MERKQLAGIARIVAGVMLVLALGSWEYSYYQILRLVVCAASFYLAWHLFDTKQSGWGWAFIVTGVLFNPMFPIHLDREVWQLLDVGGAILFFASFSAETKSD